MNIKYIGMDVHKETISIAVSNSDGRVVMESIIETKASTILQCIQGIRGELHVTLEGTWAAWLHDLLKPHVTEPVPVAVSSLLRMQQGDAVDARMLLLSEQGFASVTLTTDAESGNGCSATCDPRKNALLKDGNKSDKIDACKLADLLRGGYLRSVYHGENGLRTLKEAVHPCGSDS